MGVVAWYSSGRNVDVAKLTKRAMAVMVAGLFVVSALVVGFYWYTAPDDNSVIGETIGISDVSLKAGSKWVTGGSGTASDPYVISGLNLQVTATDTTLESYGILIADVEAHLLIHGVTIRASLGLPSWAELKGIAISRATNVTIQFSRFENLTIAIEVSGSRVDINNNTFDSCRGGIIMEEASFEHPDGMTVVQNNFYQTESCVLVEGGINGATWTEVQIRNNSLSSYKWGIGVFQKGYHFTIAGNEFSDGTNSAVRAFELKDSVIIQNRLYHHVENGGGFDLGQSSDVMISGNYISVSGPAITLSYCKGIEVSNNYITGTWNGYAPTGFGILVENGLWVNVTYNRIWETVAGVVFLSSGSGNSSAWVHHNEFVGNVIHAVDNSGPDNHWDDGVSEGNYWGAAVAAPYMIDSDSVDHFPLATPPVLNWRS